MRKIVITGMAAALALGLTACGGSGGDSAAAPSSPASSAPAPAPSKPSTPEGGSTPSGPSTPQGSDGSGTPGSRHTPLAQQGGQQITTKWGPLRYLAPGKYTVGDVAFFTATDTVVYVAGSTCPNGTPTPPDVSKCSVDGLDQWVKAAPHNASVRFSGATATRITETQ